MVTEEDINRVVRGPNDLEEMIEKLQKQKEYLQSQCRKAGRAILELDKENDDLKAELARAKEEHQYDNLVHKNELAAIRKKNE